jgi:tripartite ATP-independent transporter DctP family solute receptor
LRKSGHYVKIALNINSTSDKDLLLSKIKKLKSLLKLAANTLRRILLSLLILAATSGFTFGAMESTGVTRNLKCADNQASDYPTVVGVKYAARLISERTRNRIRITVYPNGGLGPETEVIKMVRLGVLEMARVSVTEIAGICPKFRVLLLPYLFRDDNHKWKVLNGEIGTQLLKELAAADLIGLCYQEAGYRSFYNSKHPVYQPSDLKGLKIRVQPSQIMIRLVESLGGAAVPINFQEVFSTLEFGAIDGAENNIPSYLSSEHYKVARYYSFDRHSSIPEVLIISKKVWEGLTEADRLVIKEAAKESVGYQRVLWAQYEAKSLQLLQQKGCRFNEVNQEAFRTQLAPFYHENAGQYQNLITAITDL